VKDLKKSARHSIVWLALAGIICGIVSFVIFYIALLALITGEIVPNMNSIIEIIPRALWFTSWNCGFYTLRLNF